MNHPKEQKKLNQIWKEIDNGECDTYSEKEFFEKLKSSNTLKSSSTLS